MRKWFGVERRELGGRSVFTKSLWNYTLKSSIIILNKIRPYGLYILTNLQKNSRTKQAISDFCCSRMKMSSFYQFRILAYLFRQKNGLYGD
jgi:hypothetical protein